MLRLKIESWNATTLEWEEDLAVLSDGQARYQIEGRGLRDPKRCYETSDDLHVLGLVSWFLNGVNSREYLKRQLAAHTAEVGS